MLALKPHPLHALYLAAALLPAIAQAAEHFHADMNGGMATPPTRSAGSGSADATYSPASGSLSIVLTSTALSGPVRFAQLRGPASLGRSGAVLARLSPAQGGSFAGQIHLTRIQGQQLEQGLLYLVLRTASYPEGEIRGQLFPAP